MNATNRQDFTLLDKSNVTYLPSTEKSELDVVVDAVNNATATLTVTKDYIECPRHLGRVSWRAAWLFVHQNNAHHTEGWLYNHVILMLVACNNVFGNKNELLVQVPKSLKDGSIQYTEKSVLRADVELAIILSDVGKFLTTKPGKNVWPNGTPQCVAYGHDKKSVEMCREANPQLELFHPLWDDIMYVVLEHMNAHKLYGGFDGDGALDESSESFDPTKMLLTDEQLDLLGDIDEALNDWDTPDIQKIASQNGIRKRKVEWHKRATHPTLLVKQFCDEEGRIHTVID